MPADPSLELVRLRDNIEFASIAQFFHTFQSAFRPWPTRADRVLHHRMQPSGRRGNKRDDSTHVFATEDLERMLLDKSEVSCFIELLVRMLRTLTRNRFINEQTWQTYFAREIDRREGDQMVNPFRQKETKPADTRENEENNAEENTEQAPEETIVGFFSMPLETQVHLLYTLCEWQLDDPERFREHLDNESEAVHWRVDPIGYDRKGAIFWLFDDNRLYKETPEPKQKTSKKAPKSKSKRAPTRKSSRRTAKSVDPEEEEEEEWKPWQLVCLTAQQWQDFPARFANSTHPDERAFYALLINDVLPNVLPAVQEHEEAIRKEEALANRKRSSRILYRELEALERAQAEAGIGELRRSSRREALARKRSEELKEEAINAREQRARERERRIMEQEEMELERAKRQAMAESLQEEEKKNPPLEQKKPPVQGKKRGRKPKALNGKTEDSWTFDCICGVSGKNIDDGSPMIACESCGTWQHIKCLQKNGQIDNSRRSLDNYAFVCKQCIARNIQENVHVDVDGLDDNEQDTTAHKRFKMYHPPTITPNVTTSPSPHGTLNAPAPVTTAPAARGYAPTFNGLPMQPQMYPFLTPLLPTTNGVHGVNGIQSMNGAERPPNMLPPLPPLLPQMHVPDTSFYHAFPGQRAIVPGPSPSPSPNPHPNPSPPQVPSPHVMPTGNGVPFAQRQNHMGP